MSKRDPETIGKSVDRQQSGICKKLGKLVGLAVLLTLLGNSAIAENNKPNDTSSIILPAGEHVFTGRIIASNKGDYKYSFELPTSLEGIQIVDIYSLDANVDTYSIMSGKEISFNVSDTENTKDIAVIVECMAEDGKTYKVFANLT